MRTLYVVDDDAAIRDALALLLTLQGYSVRAFAEARSFLGAVKQLPRDAVILDMRLGEDDGLAVLKQLRSELPALPVIMLTAYGDVATARAALKAGAHDFLEKPVDEQQLMSSVQEALSEKTPGPARPHPLLNDLTPREKEILDQLLTGGTARDIGERLGISARTVETHRANIMEKFGVTRLADLLKLLYAHTAP